MRNTTNGQQGTIARRAWLAHAGLLGISLVQPHTVWAAGPNKKKSVTKATPKTHYLVSAILREGVQDFTFRLVHSVQSAASVDEATGLFTRLVLEKYPGYAIAQTTVTDVVLPPSACLAGKPGSPRKPNPSLYIVSAAMSDNSAKDLDTLLVNGWLPGNNADDALKRALQEAAVKYPNYAAIRTLVTELKVAQPACSAPSPMRGHWREA